MTRMRLSWLLFSVLGLSALTFAGACSEDDDPDSPGSGAAGSGAGAGAEGGNGQGGAGTGGDGNGGTGGDPVPATLPFDWVGVIGTGQSLSVGAASAPMSTEQP